MASNLRTPVVPSRVGIKPEDGHDFGPVSGAVLIRLPQIKEASSGPGMASRFASLASRAQVPRLPLGDVLTSLGSAATQVLLNRPKLVAGSTLLAILPLIAAIAWRDQPEATIDEFPAPEVELADTVVDPPGAIHVPSAPPEAQLLPSWAPSVATSSAAPGAAPAPTSAIDPTITPVAPAELTGIAPAMPPSYNAADSVAPAWNEQPMERMARVPTGVTSATPPPAPAWPANASPVSSPAARLEGGIVPPAMGAQP